MLAYASLLTLAMVAVGVFVPIFIIALYTIVVVNACFAAIDGALSGVTSLVAVDIVHRYWPQVSERKLLTITKTSMKKINRLR